MTYDGSMGSQVTRNMEELLLRLAEFGADLSAAMAKAAAVELSHVGNIPMILLCRLDIEGPLRPLEISQIEHMTTGGASKLIDRLEADGLVERKRGVLATDKRAVLVVITKQGRDLIRKVTAALADKVEETRIWLKEIESLLPY